ncbi:MAG: hypothetical protein OIN66_05870 [Candidatus Methanoperedens sp.]|nr:hypothetical protein [Candidatus Methanoperedens sp.]
MALNKDTLKDYGLLTGRILGYIAILIGVIMTILLLKTIFSE